MKVMKSALFGATRAIPIVMAADGHPAALGLSGRMSRPTHNVTGFTISNLSLAAKRLELLHGTLPGLRKVAYLWVPGNPLAALFELVRDVNRRIEARSLSTADATQALAALRDLDRVLGVLADAADDLPTDLQRRPDERVAARAARDWAASDRLRDTLAERGIAVEDTRDGQRWRRLVEAGHG